MRRIVTAGIAALFVLGAGAGAASAQDGTPLETRLTISLENSPRPEIADSIAAKLVDAQGSPVGNADVEFFVATEFAGGRDALIGSATTDAAGVARVQLVPRQVSYEARVRFAGSDGYAPAEATALVRFRETRVVTFAQEDPTQLGSLRNVMPRAIGIVVGLLWIALIGLWLFTVRRLKDIGRRAGGATGDDGRGTGSPRPEPA